MKREGIEIRAQVVWLIKQQFDKHLLSIYYVPATVQGEIMGLISLGS